MTNKSAPTKKAFRIVPSKIIAATAAFYQHQISEGKNLERRDLHRLAGVAEDCHIRRDFASLEGLSNLLVNAKDTAARSIGLYYRAMIVKRLGKGDLDESNRILDACSAGLPPAYRSRELMARAANAAHRGDRFTEIGLYVESLAAGKGNGLCDPKTVASAGRILAYWKAIEGDCAAALANLDSIFSFVTAASRLYPFLYYDHLDTTSMVLGKMGRWVEAKAISDIVIKAPMLSSYPNWSRNRSEIIGNLGIRRIIPLVALPTAEPGFMSRTADPGSKPSNVLSFSSWKKAPRAPEGGAPLPTDLSSLSLSQKKKQFLELVTERELTNGEAELLLGGIPWQAKLQAVFDYIIAGRSSGEVIDSALRSFPGSRFR
jgi:hypothetical protein